VVEVLQIGNLLDRGVRNLSEGERQRVPIRPGNSSQARLFIMDEPLSDLEDSLKFQIVPSVLIRTSV